ncbi:permease-like cell division protein FtsX [Tepidibacter aestuarii]|uniref:permease-like cell division protein FtsX n=1 Tax=Tepidibacter aestuarii TaxID=2925782 RepID=UPI0020C16A38|nr:permease-like cell division protein FtsX [Tepidibacter aestuarii]CAH2214966.1 Cell division protein FtsX [Tepidibacter aestuarii]
MNSIIYNIKEGFKGIFRNPTMSLVSIGSVSAALFVLSIIFSIVININNFTSMVEGQFDNVQVYLNEDMTSQHIFNLEKKLGQIDGVQNVEFESKQDALNKMKEKWGEDAYLLEGIDNPLDNSFIIEVSNIENTEQIANQVNKFDGIKEVKYYDDVVEKVIQLSNIVKISGLFIIAMLALISLFIISNTIKLALHGRRREINIMKYVGATDWFIRWPFIIEGMVLGLIGALISLAITYFGYDYFYAKLDLPAYSIFSGYILPVTGVMESLINISIVMGIGVGIIGSIISLRRYLNV